MIDWIKNLFGKSGTNIRSEATVDHVELTSSHLVIGLNLDWLNETGEPIPIKEIGMRLYLGKNKEPLNFYPLERFQRVSSLRAIQKTPLQAFTLPPKEVHSEQIRFICQEVRDLQPGSYLIEVQLMDTHENICVNRMKIHIQAKNKYRRSDEWEGENAEYKA